MFKSSCTPDRQTDRQLIWPLPCKWELYKMKNIIINQKKKHISFTQSKLKSTCKSFSILFLSREKVWNCRESKTDQYHSLFLGCFNTAGRSYSPSKTPCHSSQYIEMVLFILRKTSRLVLFFFSPFIYGTWLYFDRWPNQNLDFLKTICN